MKMRIVLASAISVGFAVSSTIDPAVPQTTHDHNVGAAQMHGGRTSPHHSNGTAAGRAGDPDEPARTIDIEMVDADGKMAFVPDRVQVRLNEQVRFRIRNKGQLDHEFILGSTEEIETHRSTMEQHPDMAHMAHDEPNARRLAPGETTGLYWLFNNPGRFEFACLIPGHLEAGMTGSVMVDGK